MANAPLFGIFLDPTAGDPAEMFRQAKIADENGLDLLTIQDHPYQSRHYDSWTLMTALAVSTQRIHVAQNVGNLPLRLPAIIAKQTATLDALTGGRAELGLGTGAFWDAIEAFGGKRRTPGEAYAAYEDALNIIRGMLDNPGRSITYEGKIYSVKGARPGPAPAHRVPIWTGALGPKMLNLTGRMADGVVVSMPYVPPAKLLEANARIDEGAAEAGRAPDAIRRGYNVSGVIQPGSGTSGGITANNTVEGTAGFWVEQLVSLYRDYRQDTFLFWGSGDVSQQLEVFAKEVVPAVKAQVGAAATDG